MQFDILTLFPDLFPGPLGESVTGRALEEGKWSLNTHQIRDFATGKHNEVDEPPYGGGAGMVMRADVLGDALDGIENKGKIICLSPRGKPLNQRKVEELSQEKNITLLCGRFEGVDQRILDHYDIEEISIGDYVLSGGELAAYVLIDACIRKINGVLGSAHSVEDESFGDGDYQNLLEYPHYTRPSEWRGLPVPDVLKSGNHEEIRQWRLQQAKQLTAERRPELVEKDD